MELYDIFSKYTTSLISAFSVLIGSLIGSYFSWIIAKRTNCESIKEQYRILEENRKYDLYHRGKDVALSANIIRLDIANAISQSIRFCKYYDKNKKVYCYVIPFTKDYSSYVAALADKYTIKELSYIYQLYGVIDRLNYISLAYERYDDFLIIEAYTSILKKLYGEDYVNITKLSDKDLSYEDLYNNRFMKKGYKEVLRKLNNICTIEELNLDIMNKEIKYGNNNKEPL